MRIEGAIYPTSAAANFTRDAWCHLVKTRPEFRRRPPAQRPNPFKPGEFMTIHTTPDAAEVLADGRAVGDVSWSMSDEPLVNVSVEPSAMRFVQEWAAALGGEFRPESPEAEG
jgi:hypothetical protein